MKEKVRYNFNKAFSTYDENCQVQKLAGDKLISSIKIHTGNTKNIIDLGCGTGLLTERLAQEFPYSALYALDIADKLLVIAQERLSAYNARIVEEDFDELSIPDIEFNLACSNMAFQWSAQLYKLFLSVYAHLGDNGILAFSIPLAGTFVELKQGYKLELHTLAEIKKLLIRSGYKILNNCQETVTTEFPSFLEALHSIKAVGAASLNNKVSALRGKQFLYSLMEKQQPYDQPFFLTYKVGIFIAQKRGNYKNT